MDIYDKEISNGVDPTHELRNDRSVTNERFIINMIKDSMEKDKLRDKELLLASITRSNSVLTKRHYP